MCQERYIYIDCYIRKIYVFKYIYLIPLNFLHLFFLHPFLLFLRSSTIGRRRRESGRKNCSQFSRWDGTKMVKLLLWVSHEWKEMKVEERKIVAQSSVYYESRSYKFE